MRRFALLGFASLVSACSFVGSPFDGFGGFFGDTHHVLRNPNRPVGNSETMLRVTGREVTVAPLEPEAGNIWPGPQPPEPTLEDIERQQNTASPSPGGPAATPPMASPGGQVPPGTVLRGQPRVVPQGSSTPPTQVPAVPSASPLGAPPSYAPAPLYPNGPSSPTIDTPRGPAATTSGGNGITTYTVPGGGTGIVVPNGNGTNTLVGPDGSVQTVPAPR